MKNIRIQLLFFFSLLMASFLLAQSPENISPQKYKGPYIDAALGFFANPSEELRIHGKASLSAGFQYHHFSIGLEGLAASRGNGYTSTKFSGYGIALRYTPKRFLVHLSGGSITNGNHIEDNALEWTYQKPAGRYFKTGVAYRFVGGALYTGLSYTHAKNINFEVSNPEGLESGDYPRTERSNDFVFSLDLGFTFSGRR